MYVVFQMNIIHPSFGSLAGRSLHFPRLTPPWGWPACYDASSPCLPPSERSRWGWGRTRLGCIWSRGDTSSRRGPPARQRRTDCHPTAPGSDRVGWCLGSPRDSAGRSLPRWDGWCPGPPRCWPRRFRSMATSSLASTERNWPSLRRQPPSPWLVSSTLKVCSWLRGRGWFRQASWTTCLKGQ